MADKSGPTEKVNQWCNEGAGYDEALARLTAAERVFYHVSEAFDGLYGLYCELVDVGSEAGEHLPAFVKAGLPAMDATPEEYDRAMRGAADRVLVDYNWLRMHAAYLDAIAGPQWTVHDVCPEWPRLKREAFGTLGQSALDAIAGFLIQAYWAIQGVEGLPAYLEPKDRRAYEYMRAVAAVLPRVDMDDLHGSDAIGLAEAELDIVRRLAEGARSESQIRAVASLIHYTPEQVEAVRQTRCGNGAEQPWDDADDAYIPQSQAMDYWPEHASKNMDKSQLSKMLTPHGQVRYMRGRAGRTQCKIHLRDWLEYCEQHVISEGRVKEWRASMAVRIEYVRELERYGNT